MVKELKVQILILISQNNLFFKPKIIFLSVSLYVLVSGTRKKKHPKVSKNDTVFYNRCFLFLFVFLFF